MNEIIKYQFWQDDKLVATVEGLKNSAVMCDAVNMSEVIERMDDEIERLRAENERLRAREASLREVLNQYSCGCSSPCWYPRDSPSCGLKARTALEDEEKGQ
jgi:hypothetical protein